MIPFERFTQPAQDAAALAAEVMQRYGHEQMDSGHMLLAMMEQSEGPLPQILAKLGVDQEQVKKRLDSAMSAAPKTTVPAAGAGQVLITSRVVRMLKLADKESQQSSGKLISTEHLLLGFLAERDTDVAKILSEAGITTERVKLILKNQ
jgi:ATP-dependent Clp protease ATP-binding subunit ClpC